ncbi:kelch domain-containing protein 3 [Trichonephila clavipes]|nr:kelch domain-containing protein 3 [Trichonephila clavipes]
MYTIFGEEVLEKNLMLKAIRMRLCIWTQILEISPVPHKDAQAPCGREEVILLLYKDENIHYRVVLDGTKLKHMNDTFRYNPVSHVWTEMKVQGKPPFPRRRHCSVVVEDILYLFGGSSPKNDNDLGTFYSEECYLREHSDLYVLDFFPTLKRLATLNILENNIDTNGLPSVLQDEIKWIKSQPVYTYKRRGYSAFATGTTVSRQTVYRRLGHIGLYARRPVRCVPLTAIHCRLRLTWSREHALWTPQQWSSVMFSDESRFSLQSDSRRTLIWRAPGTRYHQENTIGRHRYGDAGWLICGEITLGSRTDLHVQSNDDRPHLSGCHSGTTCTFVSGRHGC